MPFQPGNQLARNRTSPKEFADMLRLAINTAKGDKSRLRRVAEKLIDKAEAGDLDAIAMIADRLDGKPVQALITEPPAETRIIAAWARPHPRYQAIDGETSSGPDQHSPDLQLEPVPVETR